MTWQQFIHSLEEQTKASVSRSDVLRVLIWPGGILATLLAASFWGEAPAWMTISIFVALMIIMAIYAVTFIVLLVVNPDALRSERFHIEKMAIEKGLYGNDLIGAKEDTARPRAITSAVSSPSDEDRSAK